MATEKVRGEDGGATAAVRSVAVPRGKFTVTAKEGISVSQGDTDLSAAKGETVELEGAAIQALLNDGAIEPA